MPGVLVTGPLLRRTRSFSPAVAETIASTHCATPTLARLSGLEWPG